MHVCMYVCMHVCMYVFFSFWTFFFIICVRVAHHSDDLFSTVSQLAGQFFLFFFVLFCFVLFLFFLISTSLTSLVNP